MSRKGRLLLYFFLSLSTILLSQFPGQINDKPFQLEDKMDRVQSVFSKRELSVHANLNEIADSVRLNGNDYFSRPEVVKQLNQRVYSLGEIVFLSSGDSLYYLSGNALPVSHYNIPVYAKGLLYLDNGWYYVKSKRLNEYTLWVASLVKKDYRYKNRFLVNSFFDNYQLPDFVSIATDAAIGFSIYDNSGNYAFSLLIPEGLNPHVRNKSLWFVSVFLASLGLMFFLMFAYTIFYRFLESGRAWQSVVLLLVLIAAIRMLSFYFQFPFVFYEGVLFSAQHYASSILLPSLGDLFLNVLLLTVFFTIVFSHRTKIYAFIPDIGDRVWLRIVLIAIPLLSTLFLLKQLEDLVLNSSLNLDVNFIFSPDVYNILAFLIISLLFVAYYFLYTFVYGIVYRFRENATRKDDTMLWGITFAGISVLVYFLLSFNLFIAWFLFSLSSVVFFIRTQSSHTSISFTKLIISFFVLSFAGTYTLNVFNQQKEMGKRQNVALRLASEQDPIAEFLFSEIADDLFSDYFLFKRVVENPYEEEGILEYLKNNYFNDFWGKYDIQLTICAPGEVLFFKPFEQDMVCDEYFQYYISSFGRLTHDNRFIYIDNNTGRNSYIVSVPVLSYESQVPSYMLYLEFEARFIPRELGFPELLVDERIDISRNLGNYSYALYKNQVMTIKFGSFFYSINAGLYNRGAETFFFDDFEGYSHLFYNRDADTLIVVSKARASLLERIAPFSYIFILLFLLSFLLWILVLHINREFSFSLNFKKRLQFSVIGIVLVSVVTIGGASAWFIFNIYKNKNEAIINEKAHSILIEMENLLSDEPMLNHTYHDYLRQILIRLSHVFFTDINVFDPGGNLLASSRPRVFEEGLISPLMHPVAFNQLKISGKTLHVHHESIGNLEYISVYIPLSNVQGNIIAYINLPYFAQQSELRNEISYFLVAFINIYLLLLLISVIIAFFISNHVTRPLQIIRDSMSMITLGKNNKIIEWNRHDEIGQLVGEYNRMIEELSVSAELLARSERESAWREMAKQVAHEIKNPLTPMRLNVQYLQRAWHDRADDWDERLERFSRTMVEQIDNLALIASEFSDFAKMPQAKIEEIDLKSFIPETVDLYKGFDNVQIRCILPDKQEHLWVNADKKQLLRVFNNLIKNAIQAYDKNESARVEIHCIKEDFYYKLTVKDFGVGIAEDLKQNIFQPYFTTKTAGMGLGLAMVKSIIESFNGHISFDSRKGEGTSFFIRIPASGRP